MATSTSPTTLLVLAATTSLLLLPILSKAFGVASPRMLFLVHQEPLVLTFHNGLLLKGNYTVNLIWYGSFTPSQRAIISDFISSLNPPLQPKPTSSPPAVPSVSSWWRTTESYRSGSTRLTLGRHVIHASYPLGRSLTRQNLLDLASPGPHRSAANVVLTAPDVTVEGFCMSACGTHAAGKAGLRGRRQFAYIWVGNPSAQCPGQCAWPFHQPYYGPQTPPLLPPNGDVGVDGMVINLATLLAGTVTNPFAGGYFLGPKEAPLEAVSTCTGKFGKGAYPGYPGEVLVDRATGASYNAVGVYGRKYLLPAMWDPKTSQCATLV